MDTTIVITFQVRPGREQQFLGLLEPVLDAMRGEKTFRNAILHRDPEDASRFLLYETWSDRQDLVDVQLHREYRQPYLTALPELLSERRLISVWHPTRADYSPGSESGIIRRFFASFGDPEQAKRLVDPAAQFIGVRAQSYPELPLYGTFVGHDGLERFIAGLRRAFDTQMFVIDAAIENAEVGFASGRFEHRVRQTDALLRGQWAVMCRFKDGRITHYRFYEDTAALEEAFGVHTESWETVGEEDMETPATQPSGGGTGVS